MSSPKSLDELREKLSSYNFDVTEDKMKSILFHVTDFLICDENIPDPAIDAAMYYMPQYVGDGKFVKAYQEMIWAMYEHYCEKSGVSGPSGPWVHIDSNGIHLSRDRHPYNSVTVVTGLNNNE